MIIAISILLSGWQRYKITVRSESAAVMYVWLFEHPGTRSFYGAFFVGYTKGGQYMADHDLDIKIGGYLRLIREEKGLSQQDIVEQMPEPLTIKQLDDYEHGIQPISAAQLWFLGEILQIPTAYFLQLCGDAR